MAHLRGKGSRGIAWNSRFGAKSPAFARRRQVSRKAHRAADPLPHASLAWRRESAWPAHFWAIRSVPLGARNALERSRRTWRSATHEIRAFLPADLFSGCRSGARPADAPLAR